MAKEILAYAPERFSLAGFSLGSQVALEVVTTERGRVDRVALLSATRGGLLPATVEAIRGAMAEVEAGGFDRYLDEAYPTYFAPARVEDADCKRVFVEMAHRVGAQAGLRQMQALLGIASPFAGLNEIGCPALIVGGLQDHRTSPAIRAFLEPGDLSAPEFTIAKQSWNQNQRGHCPAMSPVAPFTPIP
jgi:pimeloyl-ACP methyl ester carboxylesterase